MHFKKRELILAFECCLVLPIIKSIMNGACLKVSQIVYTINVGHMLHILFNVQIQPNLFDNYHTIYIYLHLSASYWIHNYAFSAKS